MGRIGSVVVDGKLAQRERDLFRVGQIFCLVSAFFHSGKRGKGNARKHCDDRDHDEQFNKRKSGGTFLHRGGLRLYEKSCRLSATGQAGSFAPACKAVHSSTGRSLRMKRRLLILSTR